MKTFLVLLLIFVAGLSQRSCPKKKSPSMAPSPAEEETPDLDPYKIFHGKDIKECIQLYNEVVEDLDTIPVFKGLLSPITIQQYPNLIAPSPIIGMYKWQLKGTYRGTYDFKIDGASMEKTIVSYERQGVAEPEGDGLLYRVSWLPVPCTQVAKGRQALKGTWQKEFRCDKDQKGAINVELDFLLWYSKNYLQMNNVTKPGALLKGKYTSCFSYIWQKNDAKFERGYDILNLGPSIFRYEGYTIGGYTIRSGKLNPLPGTVNEGQIVNAPPIELQVPEIKPFTEHETGWTVEADIYKKEELFCECEQFDLNQLNNIIVNVSATMPETKIVHSHTGREIAAKSKYTTETELLGLTQVEIDPSPLTMETGQVAAKFGNRKCLWVHQLDVDISYPSIVIYIDKRYPKGSCNYEATLEHELEHVSDAKLLLQEYAEKLRTALKKAPLPYKFLPMPIDGPKGETDVEKIAATVLVDVVDQFKSSLQLRRELRDANYDKVWEKCPTW